MRRPPLPEEVRVLCRELGAPARLVAHLTLVHEVAVELLEAIANRWPGVQVDHGDVAFGAATHDLGKVRFPEELTGPGRRHEAAGEALLVQRGISARRARFARTHGSWEEAGTPLEDLIVALADSAWKGERREALESTIAKRLAHAAGAAEWEAWSGVDEVVGRIAEGAGERLARQRACSEAGP